MKFETGNRCGHDPTSPRLDPVIPASERLPLVLGDVAEECKRLYWQRRGPDFAEDLGASRRSEILEAAVCIMVALLHRMDLVTRRVGKPRDDGTVVGVTAEKLAEITGINLSRVNRALGELVAAGYLFSCQPCELKEDGTYRGYPAIRTISPLFFRRLRCNLKIDRAAKKAADERKKAAAASCAAEPRRSPRAARALRRIARKFDPARQLAPAGGTVDAEERARRLANLQFRIRKTHPEWPPDRVRMAALAELDRAPAGP